MNETAMITADSVASQVGRVKCLVWDLDNTLWDGTLAEGDTVSVPPAVAHIVRSLDERGILQSIASKNDAAPALQALQRVGLGEFFLCPQISWNPKSLALQRIATTLNIGRDALGFIDDQPFERDEVSFSLPEVLCIDRARLDRVLEMPELMPRFITEESRERRRMYLQDVERKRDEDAFSGAREEFLASLGMVFTITRAQARDLQRLEELVGRTHQLNTTGYIYTLEELDAFRCSAQHDLWVAALEDRYGSYGKIGLALVERTAQLWTLKTMLMSCRVMSRGVGTVLLHHVMRAARDHGVRLRAEIVHNERNRIMYVTYKFAGFKQCERRGNFELIEADLQEIPAPAAWLEVHTET
jgi:FkbH-like protein